MWRCLLARKKLDQVHDSGFLWLFFLLLGSAYAFKAVYTAGIGKEHDIVVVLGQDQILDIVLIDGLHALDSFAATVLALEIVLGHSLDIAKLGHGQRWSHRLELSPLQTYQTHQIR